MDLSKITTKSPDRSPLCIAEALRNYLEGNIVCDVGCREGDMLVAFSQYAKQAIGIETNEDRVKIAQSKGFWVYQGNARDVLPMADVYYIWVTKDFNLEMAGKERGAVFILGGDPRVGEVYNIPGSIKLSVPYNEGDGERQSGVFELTIIDKTKAWQRKSQKGK